MGARCGRKLAIDALSASAAAAPTSGKTARGDPRLCGVGVWCVVCGVWCLLSLTAIREAGLLVDDVAIESSLQLYAEARAAAARRQFRRSLAEARVRANARGFSSSAAA